MIQDTIIENMVDVIHRPIWLFYWQITHKIDNSAQTLKLLAKEQNVTAGRISEFLDIKPSSVTQIVKKLEAAKKVKRVKSDDDARVTFVVLTDEGKNALENIGDSENSEMRLREEVFKGFTEEDFKKLNEYLTRLEVNISTKEFEDKLYEMFASDKRWQRFRRMMKNRHQTFGGHFKHGNGGPFGHM